MELKDVVEGNKLITEFLGWKLVCLNEDDTDEEDRYYEYHLFDDKGEVIETHSGGDSWCWSKNSVMEFEDDWNRLMPVGKKIRDLLNNMHETMPKNTANNGDLIEVDIMCRLHEYDIEKTWQHIVQFIIWFNSTTLNPLK